jgi:hypothetical protein
MSNPDPILPVVLTVTVYPPKKNKRMVVVSGAPEGEMPLFLTGLFQDRHTLLDQAYAQCLKRDQQLVTIAEPKSKKSGIKYGPGATVENDDEDEETPETTGQLVTDETAEDVPVSPSTEAENLPAIEGDDAPSKELDARLQPASIAVGAMSTLEEQILEWKDEDHAQQD